MKYQEIGSLTWNVPIVDPATGVPTPDFGRKWQRNNSNGDVTRGELATKADKTTRIIAGDGLTGGGDLSADRTLALEPSGVTPGSYTNTNLTVDEFGRITVAANGSGGGGGSTPVIRGSNIQSSSNSSYTVTWPVGTVAADVVLIFIGHGFGVDAIPTGWAQFGKLSGANFNGCVLAKAMTPADIAAGSVTVTASGAYNGVLVCVALEGATATTMTTSGYFARDGVGVAAFNAPIIAPAATNLVLLFFANRAASDDTSDKGVLVQTINATEASGALYAVDPASSGFTAALSFSVAGIGYYVAQVAITGP